MASMGKRIVLLSSAALLVSTLSACSSEGGTRLGSVGIPTGSSGGDGSTGTGSAGDGSGTTGTGSGGDGTTATGGTGTGDTGTSGGTAGTGSTGDSGSGSSQGAQGLGQVLVTAGNAVMDVGSGVGGVLTPVNATLPATTPITGSIINTDKDLGQTLVDVGNGKQVLVKGLLGAIGDTVAITGLNTAITSPTTGSPIIGLGALSNSQPVGTVATLGVLTDGKTATATINGVANQLIQEVTPGTLTNLAKLQVANTTLGTAANPLVGVSALSSTAANGQLVSATVLPTNGGNTATANVPVVGQVVQTVASATGGATGGTGATGLVGVTVGNTTIGSTSPAVGVNVASNSPVTGSVATATVPVVAAVTPVANSVLPAVGAVVTPSANTPVANVVAPVAAVVTPVANSVLPTVGATVNAVVTPTTTTPVKTTVTNLLGGHH